MSQLLQVQDLAVHFPVRRGSVVRAVDGVSFDLAAGETLGLVGESGCGKTTTGRAVLRLLPTNGGMVCYEGVNLLSLSPQAMRRYRRKLQLVFQDPLASLNPRLTVGAALTEAMQIHGIGVSRDRRQLAQELLERVGLNPDYVNRYPHQFSGGQRQRIGIARALAVQPQLVVCDEPVSALDVSVQAQVINLLQNLQQDLGLAYLFIAHDLSVVKHISHRVAVMYLGRIVESATVDELFANPRHPYTQALLAAIPVPEAGCRPQPLLLAGEPPNPLQQPAGCRFHPRCPWAEQRCREVEPLAQNCAPDHSASCHRAAERLAERSGRL